MDLLRLLIYCIPWYPDTDSFGFEGLCEKAELTARDYCKNIFIVILSIGISLTGIVSIKS